MTVDNYVIRFAVQIPWRFQTRLYYPTFFKMIITRHQTKRSGGTMLASRFFLRVRIWLKRTAPGQI